MHFEDEMKPRQNAPGVVEKNYDYSVVDQFPPLGLGWADPPVECHKGSSPLTVISYFMIYVPRSMIYCNVILRWQG